MFKIYGDGVIIDQFSKYPSVVFENGEATVEDNPFVQRIIKQYKHEIIQEKTYQCKKCNFTTSNKVELMAHYKSEHPKE